MINFLLLLSASTIADFKPGKTQHSCPKMAKTSLDGKERTGSLLHFLTRVIMTIFVVTRSVLLICSPITLTRFVLSPSPLRSRGCQFFLHPFFPIYLFPSQFNFLLQIFLFPFNFAIFLIHRIRQNFLCIFLIFEILYTQILLYFL